MHARRCIHGKFLASAAKRAMTFIPSAIVSIVVVLMALASRSAFSATIAQ
jgi:hypothetical protein